MRQQWVADAGGAAVKRYSGAAAGATAGGKCKWRCRWMSSSEEDAVALQQVQQQVENASGAAGG
jgi:hypothetical protein